MTKRQMTSATYVESAEACLARGMPVPTRDQWEKFARARETTRPHEGYAWGMVVFAHGLAEALPVPLRIVIHASPSQEGIGLLAVRLAEDKGGIEVSPLSVLAPEPTGVLVANRDRLVRRPPPVVLVQGDDVFMAGSERDWTWENAMALADSLAWRFVSRYGKAS